MMKSGFYYTNPKRENPIKPLNLLFKDNFTIKLPKMAIIIMVCFLWFSYNFSYENQEMKNVFDQIRVATLLALLIQPEESLPPDHPPTPSYSHPLDLYLYFPPYAFLHIE